MKCPECGFSVTRDKCVCGWTPKGKEAEKSAGITNCAWVTHGEQCGYPGTISHNTQGMGPWYCRFHSQSDITQQYGAQVVQQSRFYQPRSLAQRDADHLARLRDPHIKPKVRACEELRCLRAGTLQPNGRYLCSTHKRGEVEYAKAGPNRGRIQAPIIERQPGEDAEELELSLGSQA